MEEVIDENERIVLLPVDKFKDKYNLVYLIFYLLGIGSLLPWNFFSNATQYFSFKLRNTSLSTNESWKDPKYASYDQVIFINYLTLAAQIPGILFMFLNILLTNSVKSNIRIVASLSLMLILFLVSVIFTQIDSDQWQTDFLIISLVSVVLMNIGSAILQGVILGVAGIFPERYVQSVMSGMGLGGFFAAGSNLLITSSSLHPLIMGCIYFSLASLIIFLCILAYLCLSYLSYSKYYLNISTPTNIEDEDQDFSSMQNLLTQSNKLKVKGQPKNYIWLQLKQVYKLVWCEIVWIILIFAVTLTCYPAMLSNIKSSSLNPTWSGIYFIPVMCFLFYNISDWLGRTFAGFVQWPRKSNHPLFAFLVLSRALIVPFVFYCNFQPRQRTKAYLYGDTFPSMASLVLGLSNGYLSTLCTMYAARTVPDELSEISGTVMSFSINIGLGLGSLLSYIVVLLM